MELPELRLGFGCANFYARKGVEARRAIDAAFDNGIRWFDTARLYGHGAAEGLLGAALRGRRDKVTLVSKAGILPTKISLVDRVHGKLSALSRSLPGVPAIPGPAPASPEFGVFEPGRLRKSVERSLAELQTDWLDLLLLHECTVDQARDPGVIDLLEALRREGKIRAYGTATNRAATAQLSRKPGNFEAFQFAERLLDYDVGPVVEGPGLRIRHSVLAATLPAVLAGIARSPDLQRRAAELEGGVDAIGPGLLAATLALDTTGMVLFSSKCESRIASAVGAVAEPGGTAEAIVELARLALAPSTGVLA